MSAIRAEVDEHAPSLTAASSRRLPGAGGGRSALLRFYTGVLPLLLIALGVWMRLYQWNFGRSLWLDEALVARSLVSRNFVELVSAPLAGDQAAPVGWLFASRASITLFGESEQALRLPALLAGLLALVLAWRLARRLLPPVLIPVALTIVVLSPWLLYYSNEVKPYSFDVAAVLVVLLLALRVPSGAPTRAVLPLAVVGAVAVWFSFAAIMALAGVSVVLVLVAWARGGLRRALTTALVLASWVISLGVAYVTVLERLRSTSTLAVYWRFTFPEANESLLDWLGERVVALVSNPLELQPLWLAVLLVVVGALRLARARPYEWALACSVIAMAVVAAALKAYPMDGRLALWLVPIAALALAAVVPVRLRPDDSPWPGSTATTAGVVVALLAVGVAVAPAAAKSLPQAVQPHRLQELRPLMERLAAEQQPGDIILTGLATQAPYDFYTPRTGVARDGVIVLTTKPEGGCKDPVALRAGGFAAGRVWVVIAHQLDDAQRQATTEDMFARIEDVTTRAKTLRETGAFAVLFDPSAAPELGADAPVDRNPDRCLLINRRPR